MKRSALPWVAIAVAAPLLASVVPAAAAAPASKAAVHHASASAHPTTAKGGGAVPSAVSGYQIVTSSYSDPAGAQTSGDAKCPAGNKVLSGGAVIQSSSLDENINGSVPVSNRQWRVYINNASGTDGTFIVYAVCAAVAPGYSQVIGTSVDNPTGTQVTATATCPTGKVPVGGGGLGSSGSTVVNLNTSIPLSGGWRVDVNNNSAGGDTATAYAVCATAPPRYSQVSGNAATIAAGTQDSAQVRCPGGTVVLGGGAFSGSASVLFNLNSTFPNNTHVWKSYADNSNTSDSTFRSYAVCGKATAPAA